MKTIQFIPIAWVGLVLSGSLLLAQDARIRRLDPVAGIGVSTNVTTVSPAEGRSGIDSEDLGPELLLERRPKPPVFELSADSQYSFNSNIQMTKNHQESDGELDETLKLAATPRLLPQLTSLVYLTQQFVRYNSHSLNDYDSQAAGFSLSHPFGPNGSWGTLYAGFDANRLCYPVDAGEIFKEYDTLLGFWRSQPVGHRMTVSYGYQMDWLPSHPSSWTRVYNAVSVSVSVKIAEKLTAQLYYRLRDQEFLQVHRNDLDRLVYLTCVYTCNRFIAARIYGSYGDNSSSVAVNDYQVANGGAGLALSVKF